MVARTHRGVLGLVAALSVVLALVVQQPVANAETGDQVEAGTTAVASSTEEPAAVVSGTEEPAAVVSGTEEPAAVVSGTEEPAAVVSGTEEPAAVVSGTEEPAAVVSSAEEPAAVVSSAEEPVAVVSSTEAPAAVANDAAIEAITPMVIGVADGGTAPYVSWEVRDTAGNLVPGATFTFQYRTSAAWVTGTDAAGITDCNGTCPTTLGGNSLERDTDGGEWLLEHSGTDRTTATLLIAGNNYQVSQATAPAGYQWLVSGANTRTIGLSTSQTATWNNADGTSTHDFGTFYVRSTSLANTPLCQAGYIYSISGGGQLTEIAPDGTMTAVGSPASGVTEFNGLGIGAGGTPVLAYERSSDYTIATIWTFNTTTGQWSSTGHTINSNTSSRTVLFVAGAVNLDTGTYFIGGFNSAGTLFRIWEYDPATNTSVYKGSVATGTTSLSSNGDIAFDSEGNLFIVRGAVRASGTTTTITTVTAADLAAATGGTSPIPSTATAPLGAGAPVGVAFDSDGQGYLGSTQDLDRYTMPSWSNSTVVVPSGLNSQDLASCSSPPTVTLEKVVVDGRVTSTNQFTLTLAQGATTIGTATTAGTAVGLQPQHVGPVPATRGSTLNFTEAAAGSTVLANYVSSYRCFVDGVQVSQGSGISGSITMPSTGQSVVCRFYNSRLIANVTIHKDVADAAGLNPTPSQGWTVGASTTATAGTATQTPTATTQVTNVSGNAVWSITFNAQTARATVTVSETQQTGYQFLSGQCVVTHLDGTTATITLTSEAGRALTGIAPGDSVACNYVNKPETTSASWSKVDDSSPAVLLGGSAWTITGPGFTAPTNVIVDCVAAPCTGLDTDPVAGQFTLVGLAVGTYTVTESTVPEGYTGAAEFTFTVDATNEGTVIDLGNQVNTRLLGSASWRKVDDSSPAVLLGGSEWTITGPGFTAPTNVIVDCVAAPCTGLDTDPVAGQFALEGLAWGTYTVTESTVPAGYTGAAEFTFTVDATNAGTVLGQGDKVNTRVLGTATWTKVDAADPGTKLAGSEWTLTGAGVPADTVVVDCTAAPCATGLYLDQDPAPGQFSLTDLPWGDYSLVESLAPPGYLLDTTVHTFTVSADTVGAVIVVGEFTNQVVTPPTLPLTGGLSRDFFTFAGLGVIGMALLGFGATKRRRTWHVAVR